ncbi:MAG: hypothetical protein ACRCW3_02090 [Metamycoplasmataceae bacterium]
MVNDQNSSIKIIPLVLTIFWIIAFISTILFIIKSSAIEKEYKINNILLYACLSLFIPWIFNYLIRRKLKPFKKSKK